MNPNLCGARWSARETAAAQDAFAADGLPISRPELVGYRDGETVCLWDAESILYGLSLPQWVQSFGCCVGMGMGRAMQDSIYNCVDQIVPKVQVAWEPAYGVSRTARDIGNGQMGGNPDGNYPSWYARALRFYGVAIRQKYGTVDLTKQREDLAARWCTSSVPQQVVEENRNWPAAACFWPSNVDEVLGCLRAGYGVARAADRCTNPRRDANGFSGLVSCGGHCEAWRGVVVDKHGEPFVVEQQSWPLDQSPHGEYELYDVSGEKIELPQAAGLISMDDVKYCLRNGEVIAVAAPRRMWEMAA